MLGQASNDAKARNNCFEFADNIACPSMRLRLLGRFGVIPLDGESTPIQLPTRKSGALLAYLGMSRDYTASREELAALLWGDCSDQQARQSLRQALALLRKELGPSHLCTADTRIVRLDPAHWSIDARDFETLARSQKAEDLSDAARLFAGDFLCGVNIDEEAFGEWLSGQRTRLQLAAGQLCETLVKRPDLVIDADQALSAVEQLMALDPLREDWQRLAIALYARYRGKNEALARANIFAGLLQRELGVAPERETRAMLESIKGNDAPPPAAALPDAHEKHRARCIYRSGCSRPERFAGPIGSSCRFGFRRAALAISEPRPNRENS